MAGGSGTVFFFGYAHPDSDLDMEDWRSRDHFWDLLRYAHDCFTRYLPFHEMRHADHLTPNPHDYVFAKPGEVYAVYLPNGEPAELDLAAASGEFEVKWYDPRYGGELQSGSVTAVQGGGLRSLGEPPSDKGKDWAVLVRRAPASQQSLERERNFLVKLRTPIGSKISRAGDRVTASVISPESFLGASLEGIVEHVTANGVTIVFRSLVYKDRSASVGSVTTGFVNSKGHKLVDDEERPARVDGGAFVSTTGDFWLDEGAEVQLRVSPRR
jgi:hypothetical protein